MNLYSPKITIPKSTSKVFDFLSNLKNFEKLMPENISKFELLEKDKFIFDIKADRDLTQDEVEDIKSKMDIYLEPGLRLEINRTEQIRRPASGKQKHFYSEISD